MRPSDDEHPLAAAAAAHDTTDVEQFDRTGETSSPSDKQQDIDADWQTVTSEQAPTVLPPARRRPIDLVLHLNTKNVGSSLADVSDVSDDGSSHHFVGGEEEEQQQQEELRLFATRGRHLQQHQRPARAAAAIRRMSRDAASLAKRSDLRKPLSYTSLDDDSDPGRDEYNIGISARNDSRRRTDKGQPRHHHHHPYHHHPWSLAAMNRDSQELLGIGSRDRYPYSPPAPPLTPLTPLALHGTQMCRGFATDSHHHLRRHHHHHHDRHSGATQTSIPRLPFPLISLPEAAALQYQRRERGEEDHTDPGPMFAAKARSCTISTVSTMGPNTPCTPLGHHLLPPDVLTKPPQAYLGRNRAHGLCKLTTTRRSSFLLLLPLYPHPSLSNRTGVFTL